MLCHPDAYSCAQKQELPPSPCGGFSVFLCGVHGLEVTMEAFKILTRFQTCFFLLFP